MSGPRLNKVHSIMEFQARVAPAWVKTHCGIEGYQEMLRTKFGTAAGYIFEAVKAEDFDKRDEFNKRVTCLRCQRRRA